MSETFNRESVVRRISALMAKTTANGCTEEEAIAASKKVGEMLNQYNMSLSDIKIRNSEYLKQSVDTRTKSEQPIFWVCSAISYFTDTKCWETKWGGTFDGRMHHFFGMDVDVQVALYLYDMLQRSMLWAYEDYRQSIPEHARLTGAQKARHKHGFFLGMASRLSTRLRAMKDAQNDANKSTGRDLVVLKSAVVTEEFSKLNINLKPRMARGKAISGSAYLAGQEAGDKVAINQGVGANPTKKLH